MKYLLLVTVFLLTSCATVDNDQFIITTKGHNDDRAIAAMFAGVYGMCLEVAPISHCRSFFDEDNTDQSEAEREQFINGLNKFIDSMLDDDPEHIDFAALDEIFTD